MYMGGVKIPNESTKCVLFNNNNNKNNTRKDRMNNKAKKKVYLA